MKTNILLENISLMDNKNAKNCLSELLNLYLQNGYQSLNKKDVDLLFFHLMDKYKIFNAEDNYTIAKQLKIIPSKLKILQLESYIRWSEKTSEEILKKIFLRVFQEDNIKRLVEEQKELLIKNKIPLIIENPVEKLELEKILKDNFSITEYELNSEIVKVNLNSFVGLAIYTEENKDLILKKLSVIDESNMLKQLLMRKDFRNLKISDYRYILNELTFQGIKLTTSKIFDKIPDILLGMCQ